MSNKVNWATIGLPRELKTVVKDIAEIEDRTMNAILIRSLRCYVDNNPHLKTEITGAVLDRAPDPVWKGVTR
jgi:predicted transcriptional regulator